MPLLTVNYSDSLGQLSAEGFDDFDGLEVGPWFQPRQISRLKESFPQKPFYFHLGNILFSGKKRESVLNQMQQSLSVTHSPWLSCHTELLPRHIFYLGQQAGIYLPPPNPHKSISRFLEILEIFKKAANRPILLENLHSLRGTRYEYAASPEILSALVTQADADFLFDLAHARVAAGLQNQEVHRYIERLPLDRLKQIHVSGVRSVNGHLYDAHESMQEEDYRLLEWLLTISKPQVVTLEYIRQKTPLREQLRTLKSLVAEP